MLALDLGVFHRRPHVIHMREALLWTAVWIGLALVFNLGVLYFWGREAGLEFLTGYPSREVSQHGQRVRFPADFQLLQDTAELSA